MFKDLTAFVNDAKNPQNHMHHELPYRSFDDATSIFKNSNSVGFGFKLSVLGGANDELIVSLNKMISELPQGNKWDYQISMFGGNQVAHLIEKNTELMSRRAGICARLAKDEEIYAKYASRNGFFHRQTHHFDLRDYHAFFFVSTQSNDQEKIVDTRESIITSLSQLGFRLETMTPQSLIWYVENIVNFNPNTDRPVQPDYNEWQPLNYQVMSPDTEFLTSRKNIRIRHTDLEGRNVHSRIVSFGLRRLPSDFRLYGLPECFSSLRNVARSLQCPHIMSLNFRIDETGKVTTENDSKISSLMKTVSSKMKLLVPTAEDELEERKELQKGLLNKEFCIGSMVLTLSIFTDQEHERKHTQAAKEAFSAGGIDIIPTQMLQAQSFLSTLPFMMTDGFWQDCKRAGRVRTMKTSNIVNFFPLVLDYKNFSGGMLLPTMRQQISWFDPFNCGSDNYNIALTGGSGAGKSFFVQLLAKSIYSKFGKVWILDKGASYKKLTKMLDGTYMTSKEIFLNPFTHLGSIENNNQVFFDNEGKEVNPMAEALDNITALFATMASPRSELDSLQTAVLGDAIITAWSRKKTETLVDDVQAALYEFAEANNDRRIRDIAIQLNKYCRSGIYGDTFNKPSMLDPNIHMTTLELDGFPEAVLRPAIFALMVSINQQMYLSGSRSIPKMCIIEEAWSLLSGANAQAREFINTGYRTARKFGGSFCTVTQGINDFFANEEAEASYNNSDIHITLRQGEGFSQFIKEHPKKFSQYEQHVITNFEKSSVAGYSCAMIKAGGHVSFHRLFTDPFTRACLSTEPNEFEYCENLTLKGVPLMSAIEQTAQHFYGDEINRFNELVYKEATQ